jgi:hypothetical protein
MYCPQCGNSNPEDAAFCRICGTDLRTYKQQWDESAPADAATEPSASEPGTDAAAQSEQPAAGAAPDSPPPYQPQYAPPYQPQQPTGYQAPAQQAPYQPTYQHPPYQPTYQPGYGRAMPNIPSYMAWAIVTLILCFWPTGIVAVVYASQVGNRLSMGDLAGAQDSSHKAKTWCWVTFGIGLALWIIGIIIFILAIVAAANLGFDSNSF